jgi:beta-lactamase class A
VVARRSFTATLRALDDLAATGARVSVRAEDLDRREPVLAGDDFVTLPIGGLGVVPLLVETAAAFESGRLDPLRLVARPPRDDGAAVGLWQHLSASVLPIADLAALAAVTGDTAATNALIDVVGLPAVRARIEELGFEQLALLDRCRHHRGPDDAPQLALGTARELAALFASLALGDAVSAGVSARVSEWLAISQDVSLTASATGLTPFAGPRPTSGAPTAARASRGAGRRRSTTPREDRLLFFNKTGRDVSSPNGAIWAEAGVIAGPRAGSAYAMVVCFDDLSIMHRLRVQQAFRALGTDLMEYVF